MKRLLLAGVLLWVVGLAAAQEDDLTIEITAITTQVDALGLEMPVATGRLVNSGSSAYASVSLYAEVYDEADTLIGEGYGYLVNACGEALLPNVIIQPGMVEGFAIPLDIFEEEAEIDRVEIIPQASPLEAEAARLAAFLPGITEVTRREVVQVEWIDDRNLRYASGCWRDLFYHHEWIEYNTQTGIQTPVEHPRSEAITPELAAAISLSDPALFERSFLSFAPGQRRAVYQTELNTLVTVEPDGSFPRVLYDRLYNVSLQGVYFPTGGEGVFIAYYHAGFGGPVSYITANVNGQQLSQSPKDPVDPIALNADLTSLIAPGVSVTGKRVVVMREVNGETGYYLRATDTDRIDLLFEAEPPGNNWPPPLYTITPEGDQYVYIVRPVDGQTRLECYNVLAQTRHDLTALPLTVPDDARSWMWLSPDGARIALVADGPTGGLWLVDVTAQRACA